MFNVIVAFWFVKHDGKTKIKITSNGSVTEKNTAYIERDVGQMSLNRTAVQEVIFKAYR